MKPPAGGDDAREEGMPDFSVAGAVACHLGASGVLEDAGGLRITECPVATDVGEVVTTEFVVDPSSEISIPLQHNRNHQSIHVVQCL